MKSTPPGGLAQRILVYGVTGAGKTTMAKRLSERTGIPWHSVDDLTFEANWKQVPVDVQRQRIETICKEPRWILDTAYATWIDVPLAKVDLIVALDYPRWFSLVRLLRRTILRLFDGRTICNGNRETLRNFFSRDSIILWHFKSFERKRARIRDWAARNDGPRIVVLRTARESRQWVNDVPFESLNSAGETS